MFDRMDEEDEKDNNYDGDNKNDGDNTCDRENESYGDSKKQLQEDNNELEAFSSMLNLDASSNNSLVVNEYDSGVEDDVKPSQKKDVRFFIYNTFVTIKDSF